MSHPTITIPNDALPSSSSSSSSSSSPSLPPSVPPTPTNRTYIELGHLGQGTFGRVSKIRRLHDNAIFVWKELSYGDMNEREKGQLVSEVNILRDVASRHVIKYYDRIIEREKKKIYIVMEYCNGGDLSGKIREKIKEREEMSLGSMIPTESEMVKGRFSESFIWKVLSEISLALYDCQFNNQKNQQVIHRDIKPGNIFISDIPSSSSSSSSSTSTSTNTIKLGDFGLAKLLSLTTPHAKTSVGSPFYMSPEQLSSDGYQVKSDIWSTAVCIYEMATLNVPFKAANTLALAMKIQEGKFKSINSYYGNTSSKNVNNTSTTPQVYSESLEKIIRKMMICDEKKRLSVVEVLKWKEVREYLMGDYKKIWGDLPKGVEEIIGEGSDIPNSITIQNHNIANAARTESLLAELKERESKLSEREKRVKEREKEVERREKEVEIQGEEMRRMRKNMEIEINNQKSNMNNNVNISTVSSRLNRIPSLSIAPSSLLPLSSLSSHPQQQNPSSHQPLYDQFLISSKQAPTPTSTSSSSFSFPSSSSSSSTSIPSPMLFPSSRIGIVGVGQNKENQNGMGRETHRRSNSVMIGKGRGVGLGVGVGGRERDEDNTYFR